MFFANLLQIPIPTEYLKGLFKISEQSLVMGLLVTIILVLGSLVYAFWKRSEKKNEELFDLQKKLSQKTEEITNSFVQTTSRNNEQQVEFEKEMLQIMSGLSTILDMSKKVDEVQVERILETIRNVKTEIVTKIESLENKIKK